MTEIKYYKYGDLLVCFQYLSNGEPQILSVYNVLKNTYDIDEEVYEDLLENKGFIEEFLSSPFRERIYYLVINDLIDGGEQVNYTGPYLRYSLFNDDTLQIYVNYIKNKVVVNTSEVSASSDGVGQVANGLVCIKQLEEKMNI